MPGELVLPDKDEFKIGEVCEIAGVKPFVLRYWETEFSELAPAKGAGGQRTYSKRDVELIMRIKHLLYEERFTVAGAKKRLSEELTAPAPPPVRPAKKRLAPVPAPEAAEPAALDSAPPEQAERVRRTLDDARAELESLVALLR